MKIKLLVGNSAITEVNELKNNGIAIFRLTFYIFRMQIFHIINLNPSSRTRLIFKINGQTESMKKICLTFRAGSIGRALGGFPTFHDQLVFFRSNTQ